MDQVDDVDVNSTVNSTPFLSTSFSSKQWIPACPPDCKHAVGISASSEYSIHPPNISVNKGRKKRMMSKREEAILKKRSSNVGKSDAYATEDQVKKPRTCKSCGEVGFHDSRNCPNKECDTSSSS
ncbi:unnamed protein product [Cuscuta epithymum]|uniref:CCHC-type domain-containing protein n=1 Tax=Cuscuta epithymum TaxID=186058 RepID=A0AAV0G5B2_9ASTE|nr:unnamed protein product [Cuscuta epithymum]